MRKYTFRKEERLSREKHIQELFEKGSSFYLYPFKVFVLNEPDPEVRSTAILITVSKKNYKRAVDRNTVKRRVREGWRLNKSILPKSPLYRIGFIYTAREIIPAAEISVKMVHVLKKIRAAANHISTTS